MVTALLAAGIPMLYLIIAALFARKIRNDVGATAFWADPGGFLGAIFWPVVIPFYVIMTWPTKEERRLERARLRRQEAIDAAQALKEANQVLNDLGIDAGQPKGPSKEERLTDELAAKDKEIERLNTQIRNWYGNRPNKPYKYWNY